MSGTSTIEIECIKCGNRYEIESIDHIDLSEDRELISKIRRGKINRAQCPKCRKVMYPERGIVINFEPMNLIVVYDSRSKSDSAKESLKKSYEEIISFNEILNEVGAEVDFRVLSDMKQLKTLLDEYEKVYG